MLISDLISIFYWWLILFAISTIFLPLNYLLFKSFFDKGYAFSKILGILLLSYSVWLIASLKILPFNNFLILGVLAIALTINIIILVKKNLFSAILKQKKIIIGEELLFIGAFLFWSFIKSFEPSIHGLEKFMDYGFINSILRSEYFPPKDIWLTNFTINYYYFGHFVAALLIKLSGVMPEIGYNLTLASLFGLVFTASFSIGANLYYFFLSHKQSLRSNDLKPQAINHKLLAISGLLSAFLVTLGGNLHTIYIFFQTYAAENPVPFWSLPMMLNLDGYWYPNATRFIPFTIHEFPLYSFVVSDLHGHVLNIPFVLLTIALLIKIYMSPKLSAISYLLLALLVAVFLMTNFLDAPIYLLVIFVVLVIKQKSFQSSVFRLPLLAVVGRQLAVVVFLAILFSLPYWLSFKPFGSGIGLICPPEFLAKIGQIGPFIFDANHCTRSPFWMLLILWGFPLFILISFIFSKIKLNAKRLTLDALHSTDTLALALTITAFILILIPEFFYVKDIYPAHWRANTVFKFGYQAFIILGLTSGYMITRILNARKRSVWLLAISLLLLVLVAIYPYFAVNSYFSGLRNYQGLNGLHWLENSYPTDYQAIAWINNNISGQPVILEAQGDSYTDFARISSNTGLPTVIGWPVHEWLWRGSFDEAGKRSTDVAILYESSDIKLTQDLLKKYSVEYVFVGILERQKYTKLNEAKFQTLGKIIFQSETTTIYRLY